MEAGPRAPVRPALALGPAAAAASHHGRLQQRQLIGQGGEVEPKGLGPRDKEPRGCELHIAASC